MPWKVPCVEQVCDRRNRLGGAVARCVAARHSTLYNNLAWESSWRITKGNIERVPYVEIINDEVYGLVTDLISSAIGTAKSRPPCQSALSM